jgi:hypothetical protein
LEAGQQASGGTAGQVRFYLMADGGGPFIKKSISMKTWWTIGKIWWAIETKAGAANISPDSD